MNKNESNKNKTKKRKKEKKIHSNKRFYHLRLDSYFNLSNINDTIIRLI